MPHSIARDPRQVHLRRHCRHENVSSLAVPTITRCRQWKGDLSGMRHLRRLLDSLGSAHLARMSDDDVIEQVVRRIASGQLCIQVARSAAITSSEFAVRPTPPSAKRVPPAQTNRSSPSPTDTARRPGSSVTGVAPSSVETSWIELQMIGEDDRPLANVRYSVVLSDGTTREGTLDASGLARIDDIPAGHVIASFPDLDRDAWALA